MTHLRKILWIAMAVPLFVIGFYASNSVGYGDDQYEYYDYISQASFQDFHFYNLFANLKYLVMFLLTPSVIFFSVSLIIATFINYITLIYLLIKVFKNEKVLIFAITLISITPSVYLHSVTFLREIYVYIFFACFILYTKNTNHNSKIQISILLFVAIALLRFDMAIILSPIFIYFSKLNKVLKTIAYPVNAFFLLYFKETYENIFIGYRKLFKIQDNINIFEMALNFFLPQKGSNFAVVLSLWEFMILLLLWVVIIAIPKMRSFFLPFVFMQIMGMILLGDVSDNIGFVTRIRSIVFYSSILVLCVIYTYPRSSSSVILR
jgi:hypothetical protein